MRAPLPNRTSSLAALLGLLGAVVLLTGLTCPGGTAQGQDRNFAGSVQGSYLWVYDEDNKARDRAFDGFTTELSAKLAVDFSEHVSTNVKLCYGCHGIELDMAYVDLTVVDELRFRVGRFVPSFGEFPVRHDPANHRTVDKPLPYDMGRMLRLREWNLGVLPAPYVDNGLELGGTHWFGYSFQLDYAAYAVSGLRADRDAIDLDFVQSRSPSAYYLDNNSRPSGGSRLAATLDLPDSDLTFTLGASAMAGWYDPDAKLTYMLGGTDFYARIKRFELRSEFLLRRTEMSLGADPTTRFKYGPGKNGKYDRYALKEGFYVEGILPMFTRLELVGRVDGLRRFGNVPTTSDLTKHSYVTRYTLGTDISVSMGVRLKVAAEYYDFSSFHDELAATLGIAAVL